MLIQSFFDTRERLNETLADDICAALAAGLDAHGRASLVVCGGSSPLGVFRELAGRELDWGRVTVLPGDERWVPETHADSNAGMIRRELLQGRAGAATFVSLYEPDAEPAAAIARIDARVEAVPRPFDYVLLGMGDDGHTASLFPDSPDIDAALSASTSCVVQTVPRLAAPRISLTPHALLDSRQIGLLFFGGEKAAVFAAASGPGDLAQYPVRAVLRQQIVPVTTYHAI
jgi:6-phosphogluconolactonase